ncbi:MAG: hypothetical protein JSV71_04125 [Nitrospiraceae bacterium]|nr:MAG: hypothetical protein JSV71_04125 [Nitrospiraceae bacterium]
MNKLNIEKSYFYIKGYGFRVFFNKAREKILAEIFSTIRPASSRNHPAVEFIRKKIAPLNLNVIQSEQMRVNIIISIIDFRYVFGGYIGVFNLAKKLADSGFRIRMVITDECKYEPDVWRQEIKKYEGLENFFDRVEVAYVYSRKDPIPVSTHDVFMATSWWTAHIANYARKFLNSMKFVYLIQEYEPLFYPMGTFAALALESYTFPHYALFSTGILQGYFKENQLGVFRKGEQIGENASVAVQNAILKFDVNKTKMVDKETKKLLYYARPEEHASRNMFEMGMLAISNILIEGIFQNNQWEFYGIGSVDWGNHKINLHDKNCIKLLPKMSLEEYKKLLPEFDIGLSLMMSPHPSLPPLEMAAAGMVVVTNTYANKSAKCLRGISSNIIPAEPTISGIEEALKRAIKNSEDYEARIKGTQINWSQSWDDTYNDMVLTKIKSFIEDIQSTGQ